MQISYELTKDPQLLKEYYQLREQCYQQELRLPSFDGSEEAADRNGHIFVANNSEGCLGGARISANTETLFSNLSTADVMLTLDLAPGKCCIWERLALSQSMREHQRQPEFCEHLLRVSKSLGYDYAFMVSSVRNARFYRICHSSLNVEFQICRELKWEPTGAFAHLEHVLSVAHLRSVDDVVTTPELPGNFPRRERPMSVPQKPVYGVAA
jgi:hypothetical protein